MSAELELGEIGILAPVLVAAAAITVTGIATQGVAVALEVAGNAISKAAIETMDFATMLKNPHEIPNISIKDEDKKFSFDITISQDRLIFKPLDLEEQLTKSRLASTDEMEKMIAKNRINEMEVWAKRIEEQFKQNAAIQTVKDQLESMKQSGEIDSIEEREGLGGSIVFVGKSKLGAEFRYRVSTKGETSIKTEGIKGKACGSVLETLASEILKEQDVKPEKIKIKKTEEYLVAPSQAELERNEKIQLQRKRNYQESLKKNAKKRKVMVAL